MRKLLIALLLFRIGAVAQVPGLPQPSNSGGGSTGAGISACAATPPTAGAANSFCYDTSNIIWKCSNGASACTLAGQWTAQPASGPASGDLSGTYPAPTVAKVNGNTPGGTCTGQFVRSVDTSGRPSCQAIVAADLPALDYPQFQICITAGCGSEVSATRYPIAAASGWTPSDCSLNLAIAPTGSSVIVDVQTAASTSIFGATKLVFTTAGTSTTVVHQTTFSSTGGFFPLATDTLLKAVVTQNDSNGVAQFGYVRCH